MCGYELGFQELHHSQSKFQPNPSSSFCVDGHTTQAFPSTTTLVLSFVQGTFTNTKSQRLCSCRVFG